ncbi:MAG: acyl transferase [Chitinophagaceae bacterium]|nr:acyl transferase [Chitinophagaceae bacterium]
MSIEGLKEALFNSAPQHFHELALQLFRYQAAHVPVYQAYIRQLKIQPERIMHIKEIPFLPVRFFKSHAVYDHDQPRPQLYFESSGTTGQIPARHEIADPAIYETSFTKGFIQRWGQPSDYCILGLLPSYLERSNSSLVYMVKHLMDRSGHPLNGFYLHDHQKLWRTLKQLEGEGQATLLFGVTYALLDFAEDFPIQLQHTMIIETGGMKGRKHEMTRDEVHDQLKRQFALQQIYSEYGMSELLSQAYTLADGRFACPPWMKLLVRDINDPFDIQSSGRGAINIIDMANLYSCSFLATEDVGEVFLDGHFIIQGRMDDSEIRGCSLMSI